MGIVVVAVAIVVVVVVLIFVVVAIVVVAIAVVVAIVVVAIAIVVAVVIVGTRRYILMKANLFVLVDGIIEICVLRIITQTFLKPASLSQSLRIISFFKRTCF